MTTVSDTDRDFAKFKEHMPWEASDDVLIVLKGHLLVEELMREYCANRIPNPSHLDAARLTFIQILCLSQALSENDGPHWLWGAARKLNSLRNMLAHRLAPEGFDDKRKEFVDFAVNEAGVSAEFLASIASPQATLVGAIFLLHSSLSMHLRFKPPPLLEFIRGGNLTR